MPKTLADGRIKLTALTEKPDDLKALTLTELAAGIDLQCRIMFSDFRLSPTGSDTINDEKALCDVGNPVAFGASNYEGSVTPFRYLDENGAPEAAEDDAYETLKEKGTELWLVKRIGPEHDVEWAAGDIYDVFHVITDTPQDPSSMSGFIKKIVPLGVQKAELEKTVGSTP